MSTGPLRMEVMDDDERDEIEGRLAAADAKARSMPPEARLMYMASIVYCVRMNTNGFIPREFPEWCTAEFTSDEEDPRALAERIVARAVEEARRRSQNESGQSQAPS